MLGAWVFGGRQEVLCAPGFVVARADGTEPRTVNHDDGHDCSRGPAWSPDGTRIAFADSGPEAEDGSFPGPGI